MSVVTLKPKTQDQILIQDLTSIVLKLLRSLPRTDQTGPLRHRINEYLHRKNLASPLRSIEQEAAHCEDFLRGEDGFIEAAIALHEHEEDMKAAATEKFIQTYGDLSLIARNTLRGTESWETLGDDEKDRYVILAVVAVQTWLLSKPAVSVKGTAIWQKGAILYDEDRPFKPHDLLARQHPCHRPELDRTEGFLLSDGRFVDRDQAADVAFRAGQLETLSSPLSELCLETEA